MLDRLKRVMEAAEADYVELRFQEREGTAISVSGGEVDQASTSSSRGVGIRVLHRGAWGFGSTNSTEYADILETLRRAEVSAKVAALNRKELVEGIAEGRVAKGLFTANVTGNLRNISIETKIGAVLDAANRAKKEGISTARALYREILDHKIIVSSIGAEAEIYDSKPEFMVSAIAREGDVMVSGSESVGVTGGWGELFKVHSPDEMADMAAEKAIRLSKAKVVKGGKSTVILDQGLVGLISHEAIGHTTEADFVLSGSAAAGMVGKKVASPLVTLVDSGISAIAGTAAGSIPVDDEGTLTQEAVIIEKGIMKGYMHNRETAHIFEVEPTGNARAYEYTDEPIIRMRNTFILPGDMTLEEMLEGVNGYLLKGAGSGQADANAEFMFDVQEAYKITDGEVGELFRGASISGNAFDVLKSVDAIGRDFAYDMGAGYCGKGQPAKVDGGGGPVRAVVTIGGVHQ